MDGQRPGAAGRPLATDVAGDLSRSIPKSGDVRRIFRGKDLGSVGGDLS